MTTGLKRMFVAAHYLDDCGSDLSATHLDQLGQSYPQATANMTYPTKHTQDPNFGPAGIPELLRETLVGCVSQAYSNTAKWPFSPAFPADEASLLRGQPADCPQQSHNVPGGARLLPHGRRRPVHVTVIWMSKMLCTDSGVRNGPGTYGRTSHDGSDGDADVSEAPRISRVHDKKTNPTPLVRAELTYVYGYLA